VNLITILHIEVEAAFEKIIGTRTVNVGVAGWSLSSIAFQ
jgi:hypothetical protein